jgi:transposase
MYMSRPLGSAAELERRRRRALDLLSEGKRQVDIAEFLGVDRNSIYRWRRAACASAEGLAAKPHPHRPPALTMEQLHTLESLLAQGAAAHGWHNHLWTTDRVATLIERYFKVRYHHDHVGRFLRQRLGWSVQKPRRRAKERDEQAILRWQSEEFPRIAREAQARNAHIVFLDESGFFLTPTVRRTWGPRGQTPVLDAWNRRDRISAISSISVSPRNHRLTLHFDLLPKNTNVHADDIVAYLRDLKAHLRGPLTIVWDRGRVHDRSQLVQAFLAEHPEIITEKLPAYAPELNPDELVWAWTKYGRLGNLAAQHTDWLREYLINEFKYVREHPELMASFIEKTKLPLRL